MVQAAHASEFSQSQFNMELGKGEASQEYYRPQARPLIWRASASRTTLPTAAVTFLIWLFVWQSSGYSAQPMLNSSHPYLSPSLLFPLGGGSKR